MAILTNVKENQTFSKASKFLLTTYMRIRKEVFGNRGYAINLNKKLEYLKMFQEANEQYSYRVIGLALRNISKTQSFQEHMGFFKESFNAELKKAYQEVLENVQKINPKIYNVDKDEFQIIKTAETSEEYIKRIQNNPYKKIGDL